MTNLPYVLGRLVKRDFLIVYISKFTDSNQAFKSMLSQSQARLLK